MKNYLFMIFVLINFTIYAQIPENYYSSTEGMHEEELKTALYNIIKGHTEYPYSSSQTDTWDILKDADEDPDNPDNVILIYTGWSVDAEQEYNNGSGWNREHTWAKSRGDFGTSPGPGTDAHHLRASNIATNGARENRWFGNCSKPYYENGENTGCFTSSTLWLWQPRDEVKGDVARMIFYMAVRYEGENGEPDLEVIDYLPENKYTNEPVHALLTDLLQWHKDDPVDENERKRNDVVYSYQHNRNPFIDNPDFVELIWDYEAPSMIEKKSKSKIIHVSENNIYITTNEKSVLQIVNTLGQTEYSAKIANNYVFDKNRLPEGIYFVILKNKISQQIITKRIIVCK